MLPEVGLSRAPIRKSSVLFPLPLLPTTTSNVPDETDRLIPLITLTTPSPDLNSFFKLFTLSFFLLIFN